MSDLYTELLVKKKKRPVDSLIKYGLIVLTAVFALAGLLIHPLILVGAVGLVIADIFLIPRTDLEYEYLFVNGEFDIDVIMSQQKRKRVCSFSLKDCDIAAPVKSHRMDYYNNNEKLKVMDFSSGEEGRETFAIITRVNEEPCRVILEPDQNLKDKMKKTAPGKVFLD